MGKVVVSEFLSLDGVMEDPGGAESYRHGGWSFKFDRGPDGDKFKLDEVRAADALLLGRTTYEGFAAAWPKMADAGEFGEKFNSMPKFVYSTTLEQPEWNNTTVIRGALADEIGKLKQQFDGDILLNGSAQLAQALHAQGLVDKYHLMVFPVVLGSGKRLFSDSEQDASGLRLTSSNRAGETLILILEPATA